MGRIWQPVFLPQWASQPPQAPLLARLPALSPSLMAVILPAIPLEPQAPFATGTIAGYARGEPFNRRPVIQPDHAQVPETKTPTVELHGGKSASASPTKPCLCLSL